MRGSCQRWLFPILALLCTPAFTQNAVVVRIGVAPLRSGTDKVSVTEARDRLVKALSHQKIDKKQEISFQAVGLDSSQGSVAVAEAKAKNCQFVVFSHLTDLQISEKTVPNGTSGHDYVPFITAKVAYQIERVADGAEYSLGAAKMENEPSIREAVVEAMERVAASAIANLKKGGNVPLRD